MPLTLDPTEKCLDRLLAAIDAAIAYAPLARPTRLTCGYLYTFHGGPAPAIAGRLAYQRLAKINAHFAPRGLRVGFTRGARSGFTVYRSDHP
jgi:hypothetical protein